MLGERSGQLCVITRCNYTLFNEAVSVCCAPNNTKVGFVGVRSVLNLFCVFVHVYFRLVVCLFVCLFVFSPPCLSRPLVPLFFFGGGDR